MLRIGLIGCGRRGQSLLPLLQALPNSRIVAVGDLDRGHVERAVAHTGAAGFDPSQEDWPGESPDLIVLATPAAGRAELVQRFARPGVRAILVEKPIALTLAEVDRMCDACEATGIQLSVGQHWRFCRALQGLRDVVQSGQLGEIESIHASGYGNLLDQGWHLLDAARWVLGDVGVQWAGAHGTNNRELLTTAAVLSEQPEFDPQHPAPVWTVAELSLDGQVRMHLEAGPLLRRTGAPLGPWHERRLRVQGTHGSAECRPGHYLRVQVPGAAPPDLHLDPASLDDATRDMLAAVLEAALNGTPVPSPARDARRTLEGLLLCGCSLRDRSLAIAPLPAWEDPFATLAERTEHATIIRPQSATASAQPRFSVLIPLIEDRGFAPQCLEGWLQQERIAPEGFELLLLDDGTRGALGAQLQPSLRRQDRVLRAPGVSRSGLYDAGAKASRGDFLLLSESHCVPEPDLLVELDDYLRTHDYDGACCRSIPVAYNNFARADAVLFEDGFRQFRRPGDWRKVNVHAFALRRDLYHLVGGLKERYRGYAEMVLAADLRDAGVRLGYAAGASVQHHYRVALMEVLEQVDDFVSGEYLYRLDHGSVERIGFSFIDMCAPQLESQSALQECLRIEWQRLRADMRRGDFSALGRIYGLTRRWLGEHRFGASLARLGVSWAAVRCWLVQSSVQRLPDAYRGLWAAAIYAAWRQCRLTLAAGQPAPGEFRFNIDDLPEDWLFGFFPAEPLNGRMFRWTRPVAGIDLPLQPGEYLLTLETGKIRPWPGSLRFTLCGQPIPPECIQFEEEQCRIRLNFPRLTRMGRRTLGLSCLAWDVGDVRQLGLPIFGIQCEQASFGDIGDRDAVGTSATESTAPRDRQAA